MYSLKWLRRTVSLLLAYVLFSYGTGKVLPLQFGRLSQVRLSERVGDLDRCNMLWTFMAASTPYICWSSLSSCRVFSLIAVRFSRIELGAAGGDRTSMGVSEVLWSRNCREPKR